MPARVPFAMLTASERRTFALTAPRDETTSPSDRAVASAALRIIQEQSDRLARVFTAGLLDSPDQRCLSALIKPVGDSCNLRCKYCFNRPEQPVQRMSEELLERIISQVMALSPGKASFSFHGGEPLLAGIDFFRLAVALQTKYRRPGQQISNSVQSNGTLLNREWGRFFAENGFRVGVSIDGPPEVHDANRVDSAGRGSIARLLEGIAAVQEEGVQVSAIAVVTCPPAAAPGDLFRLMTRLGIRKWRANPCRAPETVSCFGQYIEDLFDAWACDGGGAQIGIIDDVMRALLGYSPQTCALGGSCANFPGFEPDGTVSPCCEMSLEPRFHFGNILSDDLVDILNSPVAEAFWRARADGDAACGECDWWDYCHGGCTYHRIQASGCPGGVDYLCEAYKDVFTRLARKVDAALAAAAQRPGREGDRK
ncbi:MAG: radical SAM protein [Armatimonadetes bacterium]|nr:radical SAM protein [Armatimonadota bacterium]